jgi:probable rRNA maturation factor
MSVDIANESGLEVSEAALAALATYVLDQMRINPLAELSVLLVDENAMADLHQRWMGEPGPTDVLAFPMDELRPPPFGSGRKAGGHDTDLEPSLLGDVVLCPQIAAKQAHAAGHSTEDEIELLCTHGILHLLGYDHADTREHATMFGVQERLLASWHASGGATHTHPGGGTPGDGGGRQEGPG